MRQSKEVRARVPKYLRVSRPANVILSVLFILLALMAVIPTVFCLIISLSSENSVSQYGYRFIPKAWSLNAYRYLWTEHAMIGNAFFISILITVVGTVLGLFLNATIAYALSRPHFRLRKPFTVLVIIPMLFQGGMVASYMINTQMLGLRNNVWALILPLAVSTWYIMILNTFFRTSVPESLIESAQIDGASQLIIFMRIVLPISLPALATIGLFLTFRYWNDWFQALLYIDSSHPGLFPLQYLLISIQNNIDFIAQNPELAAQLKGSTVPSETVRMAIVMVVVIPIACAYPFFQKYFISGLTVGAVKG